MSEQQNPDWDDQPLPDLGRLCGEIDAMEASGNAGDGAVTVVAKGNGRIHGLTIQPNIHASYDAELLARLVEEAIDAAYDNLQLEIDAHVLTATD